jgi:hypothetical protein
VDGLGGRVVHADGRDEFAISFHHEWRGIFRVQFVQ